MRRLKGLMLRGLKMAFWGGVRGQVSGSGYIRVEDETDTQTFALFLNCHEIAPSDGIDTITAQVGHRLNRLAARRFELGY